MHERGVELLGSRHTRTGADCEGEAEEEPFSPRFQPPCGGWWGNLSTDCRQIRLSHGHQSGEVASPAPLSGGVVEVGASSTQLPR